MPNSARLIGLLSLIVLTFLPGGCPPDFQLPTPEPQLPSFNVAADLKAEIVVSGAATPAGLAATPDGRVFFTEKNTGRIRVIFRGSLLDEPFAEVPVNNAGERGLLGIAVHPDFARNGRVYVFYSRSDTGLTTSDSRAILDNRVVYFEAAGDVASGGEIFVQSLPADFGAARIGGRIGFGPDEKLYVAAGDLGDPESAQDVTLLSGKILRLNDDGSVPTDNPFPASPVFSFGLRDPRGIDFDVPGDVLVLDHNAAGNDELHRAFGTANLGWPAVVGSADTAAERQFAAATPNYTNPLLDSGTGQPGFAGAALNTGNRYGFGVRSDFFYGESSRGRVIRARFSEDGNSVEDTATFAEGLGAVTDIAFTASGTLYVANATAVYRLAPIDD